MPREHVLILPGGGYQRLSDNERVTTLAWLARIGVDASWHAYPVAGTHPAPLRTGPLASVRAAIRERRDAGTERVALLGYSAGGHAAGMAAYAPGAAPDERPDLAILCYPVVSMELPTHAGSRVNLLGSDASDAERAAASLDRLVAADAPPTFVWHTAEDRSVPVEHTYRLGSALAAAGVAHALHVFPRGPHGLNVATGAGDAGLWTELCAAWLREQGWAA